MAFEEKTIESNIVYEGPVFKVRKYKVSTKSGESYRDVVEHNGGAVMIAVTSDGKIIMERQYRKALEREVLELPAGKIEPGEEPEVAAVREIQEETGYKPNNVKHLISFAPSCGYAQEKLHIYIMRDLEPVDRNLDEDEDIDILMCEVDDILRMIMDKKIEDAKTLIGIMYARMAGEI